MEVQTKKSRQCHKGFSVVEAILMIAVSAIILSGLLQFINRPGGVAEQMGSAVQELLKGGRSKSVAADRANANAPWSSASGNSGAKNSSPPNAAFQQIDRLAESARRVAADLMDRRSMSSRKENVADILKRIQIETTKANPDPMVVSKLLNLASEILTSQPPAVPHDGPGSSPEEIVQDYLIAMQAELGMPVDTIVANLEAYKNTLNTAKPMTYRGVNVTGSLPVVSISPFLGGGVVGSTILLRHPETGQLHEYVGVGSSVGPGGFVGVTMSPMEIQLNSPGDFPKDVVSINTTAGLVGAVTVGGSMYRGIDGTIDVTSDLGYGIGIGLSGSVTGMHVEYKGVTDSWLDRILYSLGS
ncbi:MAG: hypothetical protein R3C28_26690 [Pirellulaceae bacterium]